MIIKVFEQGSIGTNCYIAFDENTLKAFVVDVSDKISSAFFTFIEQQHLHIEYALLTHGHYDHAADIKTFCNRYPTAQVVISNQDYQNILKGTSVFCEPKDFIKNPILVKNGDKFDFLGKEIEVIATPGHTSGSVCYLYENVLFCGDTVFYGSIGRTDLPTGSFFEIMQSVAKINALGDLRLLPGHMQATDIPTQRKVNPYFRQCN